jgi:hypothetical protein
MADPADPPTPPADPADPPAPADPPDLGDAGKKALDEERAARRAAEKLAKAHADELDKLRKATMSEQEKAVAEAKAAGRQEALAEANSRLLRSEIRAAAAGKLADPGDAAALLGDLDQFLDKSGEPDVKAITSAIDALVKAKPYLAPAGARPGGLPGGGAKPSSGTSINDHIRQMAGR